MSLGSNQNTRVVCGASVLRTVGVVFSASIFTRGTVTTVNCTFENNTVVVSGSNAEAAGGAIYAVGSSRLFLNSTIFRANKGM